MVDYGAPSYQPLCHWAPVVGGIIPPDAISAGIDRTGEAIYIGRARHAGDILPGHVIPTKKCCYVTHSGKEHSYSDYEVLVAETKSNYGWEPCENEDLPTGAIQGGRTADGEGLYIGRVPVRGKYIVGKIHSSHRVCYVPYDGKEVASATCEAFVCSTIWLSN